MKSSGGSLVVSGSARCGTRTGGCRTSAPACRMSSFFFFAFFFSFFCFFVLAVELKTCARSRDEGIAIIAYSLAIPGRRWARMYSSRSATGSGRGEEAGCPRPGESGPSSGLVPDDDSRRADTRCHEDLLFHIVRHAGRNGHQPEGNSKLDLALRLHPDRTHQAMFRTEMPFSRQQGS